MAAKKQQASERIEIQAPNLQIIEVPIRGNSNYVFNSFGWEARNMMREAQAAGQVDRKKKKEPKDFEQGFRDSLHISEEGRPGIPCVAIRAACVRAAQLCGIEMTRAKMCVFVLADALERDTGSGLVLFTKGEVEKFESYVRLASGVADIRARGRIPPGWEAVVRLQFDADFLSASSVVNLLARAGVSVGVGAGRPFSAMSVGQGWGTFDIVSPAEEAAAE